MLQVGGWVGGWRDSSLEFLHPFSVLLPPIRGPCPRGGPRPTQPRHQKPLRFLVQPSSAQPSLARPVYRMPPSPLPAPPRLPPFPLPGLFLSQVSGESVLKCLAGALAAAPSLAAAGPVLDAYEQVGWWAGGRGYLGTIRMIFLFGGLQASRRRWLPVHGRGRPGRLG